MIKALISVLQNIKHSLNIT